MSRFLARKIADGVLARLEWDYACNRGHSFGEMHVHGAVNEVLSSNIDPRLERLHTNFAHPAIRNPLATRGSHRSVDFHIEERATKASTLSMEVKWAGSGHASADKVVLDLCRLAEIKLARREATTLFLLAGARRDVDQVLAKLPRSHRMLPLKRASPSKRLPAWRHYRLRESATGPVVAGYGNDVEDHLPAVHEFITTRAVPDLASPTQRWSALVWHVGAPR